MTNKIKEFLDLYNELEFGGCCVLISDNTTARWNCNGDEVYWKEDGDMYSAEIMEGEYYQDGYFICNADTGCGQWVTNFFLLENRDENLSEDEEGDFDDE